MQHATERVERPAESQEALEGKKEHASGMAPQEQSLRICAIAIQENRPSAHV